MEIHKQMQRIHICIHSYPYFLLLFSGAAYIVFAGRYNIFFRGIFYDEHQTGLTPTFTR